jgi:hypothetical protein
MSAVPRLGWLTWPAWIVAGLLTGAVGVRVLDHLTAPSEVHADPAYRAARAAGADLSPSEWQRVSTREGEARTYLGLHDEQAVREWVGEQAEAFAPTEDDLRALWDRHRQVFGTRTFEQSRSALDRLARLRHVRQRLDDAGGPP